MKGPFCGGKDSEVIDTRHTNNSSIRRRRVCESCGKRFTTYEKIETVPLMVVKKSDIREPYDRAKLEGGIIRACHKRPISASQISDMVDRIESQIYARDDREIKSAEIGELVMEALREVDDVAYVRFASVYREFKDVDTFLREIEKIAKKKDHVGK